MCRPPAFLVLHNSRAVDVKRTAFGKCLLLWVDIERTRHGSGVWNFWQCIVELRRTVEQIGSDGQNFLPAKKRPLVPTA